MQAKDIPEDLFLTAIRTCARRPGGWTLRWDVEIEVSRLMDREVPWKVTLAKARSLIRRGIIDGCACGCRGDWHIPDEVKAV